VGNAGMFALWRLRFCGVSSVGFASFNRFACGDYDGGMRGSKWCGGVRSRPGYRDAAQSLVAARSRISERQVNIRTADCRQHYCKLLRCGSTLFGVSSR
jgi:hypothetical protein